MSKARQVPIGVAWVLMLLLAGSWPGWRPAVRAEEAGKAARTPVGTWKWFSGTTVEFKANGQTEAANGMKGRWTGGNAVQNVVVKWENGATDTLGFSPDNARLYNVYTNVYDTIGERIVPTAGSAEAAAAATPTPKAAASGGARGKTAATLAPPTPAELPPIGNWHWFNDQTVTFKRTGEIEASGGWRGKWFISVSGNREVAILWDGQPADVVTLSADGKKLAGGVVSAERIEGEAAQPTGTPPPTGTTKGGGTYDGGIIYRLNPPATASGAWTETILHDFTNGRADGASPGELTAAGNGVFYGTTISGGPPGDAGGVFSFKP